MKLKKYNNRQLMGIKESINELISERNKSLLLPTELGKEVGKLMNTKALTGRTVNLLLDAIGFQKMITIPNYKTYRELTKKGIPHGEMFLMESKKFPVECLLPVDDPDFMDYQVLRDEVYEGRDSWDDYIWEEVCVYRIKWGVPVINIIINHLKGVAQ